MLQLASTTPDAWLHCVLGNFDEFVVDHALCERKASALGMSLVAKYPDRTRVVDPLIAFAREELEHFHIMVRVVLERGLTLAADERDPYVNQLRQLLRPESDSRFMDRLLISGVIEARGCERLQMVTRALPSGALKDIYLDLTRAEARHHALFFRLAEAYFDPDDVRARGKFLFAREAEIVESLPVRPRVH